LVGAGSCCSCWLLENASGPATPAKASSISADAVAGILSSTRTRASANFKPPARCGRTGRARLRRPAACVDEEENAQSVRMLDLSPMNTSMHRSL
jgi:hypothetical protein